MRKEKETKTDHAPPPTSVRCKTQEGKQAVLEVRNYVNAHPESAAAIRNFVQMLQESATEITSYDLSDLPVRVAIIEQQMKDLMAKIQTSVDANNSHHQDTSTIMPPLHTGLAPHGRPRRRSEHLTKQQKVDLHKMLEENKSDDLICQVFNLTYTGLRYQKKMYELKSETPKSNQMHDRSSLNQIISIPENLKASLEDAGMKADAIEKHVKALESKNSPQSKYDQPKMTPSVVINGLIKPNSLSLSVQDEDNGNQNQSNLEEGKCEPLSQPKRGLKWGDRIIMAYMLRSWQKKEKYTLGDIAKHFNITKDSVKKHYLAKIKAAGILDSDKDIELADIVAAFSQARKI